MRRDWLITTAAALCVVSTTTRPVAAGPSGMTLGARPVASKASAGSWTDKIKFWDHASPASPAPIPRQLSANPAVSNPAGSKPTDAISPWRNPISYFSAAMAETPVATALKKNSADGTAPNPSDKLSLDTPTGPATPQFYIAMSQMSERQGGIAQARQQLQQALAKWPRDVELLRAAARMEDRQGNLPLAETLYHRAVAANPQHAGAMNDLGLCLARQGKLEQSVQSIEQAINLQPDKPLYRNNAATVLVEMGEDRRALAHLSAVHGAAESNYNLGQLLVDRGRSHEAIAYFQQAVEIDPNMQPAQAAIAQLRGEPVAPTQFAAERAAPQQDIAPVSGPQLTPQQPVQEPTIPTTARGPAFGTSSYVPPTGYYPSSPVPTSVAPTAPVYQTATAPRYLPPVRPIVPGSMVR